MTDACKNIDLPMGAFSIHHRVGSNSPFLHSISIRPCHFTMQFTSHPRFHSRVLKRHIHVITLIHSLKTVHQCGKPVFIALSSITCIKCKRFTGWLFPSIKSALFFPDRTCSPSSLASPIPLKTCFPIPFSLILPLSWSHCQ
ncbi:uncharacterized protein BDW43DRAFT_290737 [Aspergillus alliaceus]|uniref:uncharacterized protein n=1 Tax=Petromyces alliaceus TaxID=209559 RepID=UPI0012A69B06|nr:uncharacterized protein BDW43DRAFT_290737 [Aspergillus alliaceus]KAB8228547.1 hypothetical protein BDW43DRAFT_290737 [Aspergillus alliaceus]